MNTVFDEAFLAIPILRLHPSFLPFVGSEYERYRVLHVGESHYIDNEAYDIQYFQKWWDSPCEEVEREFAGWFTRPVIERYMSNAQGSYTIFSNFLKSFCRCVLHEEVSICPEVKKRYEYLAFMNFFQMPSLYPVTKYWDSLVRSAEKAGNSQLAYDMWEIACNNAAKTLDSVIDILKPRAVVITSISAGNAYKEFGGRHADSIIFTSHPAYPYTWQKPLKSLDGQKGVDVCEAGLRRIFG